MNDCPYCGTALPPAPTDDHRAALLTVHKPKCPDWPDLDALISEAESLQADIEALGAKVWDFLPMLEGCEKPIGDANGGIDALVTYLHEHKSATT